MPRPRRSWFGLLLLGLILLPQSFGCTAAIARSRIRDAELAVASAEQDGPAVKATYEYASALLYLEKAREQEAYSRFGVAMELSDISTEYAQKAKSSTRGLSVRAAAEQKPTK